MEILKEVTTAGAEGLTALTEELGKRRKVLVNQARTKQEIAVGLLYSDYETRLSDDSFVDAINLVENEGKAIIFVAMHAGSKRDQWLRSQITADLEPLEI